MPTPQRTAVLLLAQHAAAGLAAGAGASAAPEAGDEAAAAAAAAAGLAGAVLALARAPAGPREPALAELLGALSAALGPREGASAGAVLLEALDALGPQGSPDALVSFYQSLPGELLEPPGPEAEDPEAETVPPDAPSPARAPPSSALGLFVRECCVAFDLLSFEGVGRLWEALRRYRQSPEESPFPARPLRPALPHSYHRFLAMEGRGSGLLLLDSEEEGAAAPLVELPLPDHPRAHLLQFRAHQRRRNYSQALAALHAHYDSTGGREASLRPAPSALGHFHFAALAQCTALAEQGRRGPALRALEETIRVAQQAGDSTCLTHALAQLCRLTLEPRETYSEERLSPHAAGAGGGAAARTSSGLLGFPLGLSILERRQNALRLLRRCLQRSRELKLPHLEAFACLALAQFHMLHSSRPLDGRADGPGRRGEPPRQSPLLGVPEACEHVTLLRREAALAAALAMGEDLPGGGSGSAMGPETSTSSTPAAAAAGGDDGRGSGRTVGGQTQSLKAGIGSASAALEGCASSAHLLRSSYEDLTGRPSAARSLFEAHATAFGLAGGGDLAADRTVASVGTALLAEALGTVPPGSYLSPHRGPYNSRARAGELASRHRALCLGGDFRGARHLAAQMEALYARPASGGVAAATRAEAALLGAAVQLGLGRAAEAATEAAGLFAHFHSAGLQLEALRGLLLVATARREGGHPEAAVPYALSALTQSRAKGFRALEAECHVFLSELWLGLDPACAPLARGHLAQCLRPVLSDAHAELRARAQMAAARAALWEARASGGLGKSSEEALSMLEGAAQVWEAMQAPRKAAEAHRLRALVYHEVGDTMQRDAAASRFRHLTVQPNPMAAR